MRERLKPCPFCGQMPSIEYNDRTDTYAICCNNSECACAPCTDNFKYIYDVKAVWNRRAYDIKTKEVKV